MGILQIMELTHDNFSPFGKLISNENMSSVLGDENFSWWEGYVSFEGTDRYGLNILQVNQRELLISKIEHHKNSQEVVIPLGGDEFIIVVAPAGNLNENELKAFRLPGDKGVVINEGVRHFLPYPLKKQSSCVIMFKRHTEINDLHFEDLSEKYVLQKGAG